MSFNQMTADQLSLAEAAALCAEAGIRWFGPWRHKVAEVGAAEARRILDGHGLRVSSLCRGGFFLAADEAEDNRRAVEEAAALGTDVLVLVCGPPEGTDVDGARARIEAGIERLLPHAAEHGVRLGIEPLHPMMISERSAIVTLGEALDMAERIGSGDVGVIVDAYHVWWDPRLYEEIARAGRRILGYHVADWLVPTTDRLQGRGMMGEGVIELKRIRAAVEAAGYAGPIEVEVINREAWRRPGAELVEAARDAFAAAA
ncbi:MAG: sugar phosphate isomerase/epimerase family protein [Solirubrobacteraceae bacterium]|jgi:sugar phosphate isomerase/epimerase